MKHFLHHKKKYLNHNGLKLSHQSNEIFKRDKIYLCKSFTLRAVLKKMAPTAIAV
jgi:hypothetical protein